MVLFNQARRFDDVGRFDRVRDLLHRDVVRGELVRIDDDMKLARLSSRDADDGHARQARELRTNYVSRDVAQAGLITLVGSEAVAGYGKDREGQPLDIANLRRGRQRG